MFDEKDRELMTGERKNSGALKVWKTRLYAAIAVVLAVVVAFFAFRISLENDIKKEYEDKIAELIAKNEDLTEQLANLVKLYEELSTEVDLAVIETNLKEIGELATMEYQYTNVGKFTDDLHPWDIHIPFTEKTLICKWDGVIKAGIDMNEVVIKIDKPNKKLTVHTPAAKILSHETDENSYETLQEKDGLWNRVKAEDVRKMDKASKEEMEKRVIGNSILEKANANAEVILRRMLLSNSVIAKGYTIEFVVEAEA